MPSKVRRRSVLASIPALGAASIVRKSAASSPATVRFAFFGDEVETLAYELLIQRFQEEYPNISVEAIPVASRNIPPVGNTLPSGGYPEWLRQSFTSGSPPDVFMLAYRDIGRYVTRGIVEPLDGYLRNSAVFSEDDFYPTALDAFRSPFLNDNELAAIPQNVSSLVVYYNTDMFDAMDIERPVSGWSWDEFASAASALTLDLDDDGRIDVHGVAFEPSITRFAPFIWGAGGEIYDDLHAPTKLLIDTPEARAGIQWLSWLGAAGLNVTPTAAQSRQLDDTRRFRSGHAAMLIQSRRVTTFLRQNSAISWDVAPLPVGNQPVNLLHSDGLAMYVGTKDKEAAWKFIEFAMGPVGQTLLAESGRTVPSLRSVAESDAFMKGTSISEALGFGFRPKSAQVFLDNVAVSRRLPSEISWSSVVRGLDEELKNAFYNGSPVDETVGKMLERTNFVFESSSTMQRRIFQLALGAPESED